MATDSGWRDPSAPRMNPAQHLALAESALLDEVACSCGRDDCEHGQAATQRAIAHALIAHAQMIGRMRA